MNNNNKQQKKPAEEKKPATSPANPQPTADRTAKPTHRMIGYSFNIFSQG